MTGAAHDDWMVYDAVTGDLLDGPVSHEHARRLTDAGGYFASAAMARRGEMRFIQDGFARRMSGNPPRDLRGR